MSEDVSATMRVGITVILVAALVATVLNLMVMSNSILSGGQTTLQSGIDSVSTQEFAPYDNTKVSGTQVCTALSLFQGRDVAVVIETKAFSKITRNTESTCTKSDQPDGGSICMNYGALLCRKASDGKAPMYVCDSITVNGVTTNTKSNYSSSTTCSKIVSTVGQTIQGSNGAPLYVVTLGKNANAGDFYQNEGEPYYLGLLFNQNGMVQTSYNTVGTTSLGNPQYILSSARFASSLIKDTTGSIIGIYFYQLA